MRRTLLAILCLLQPATTSAQTTGDPDAGERGFTRCRACHSVTAADGTVIVRGGATGPNLFGIIGRPAGTGEGYRYSQAFRDLAASGFVWSEADLASFVADPPTFLQQRLGDPAATTGMGFRLRSGGEDIAAWLALQGTSRSVSQRTKDQTP
ncbi:c-type cytochrome [Pseudogemmobacter faecipullorum]|uniref:Cytochrome C n=1 Tax=Pseudogemmobacter faecipullorum TaxID=2755041 RepID=A0ABS8CSD0_9RHOB|nr:cytochrome C [Pseudogemmobacter faecipullorum]MCB5412309.1 cytochrome C [Pseudogemmobacter faecipullorum]